MTAPVDRPDQPHTQPEQPAYPASPWQMVGSLWLTLFRVAHDVDALRPKGIYGAAFVSYEEGSPLTYSELLVARPLPSGAGKGRKVTITDIWVDSPASVAGGRELWAIPKGLCDFERDSTHRGPFAQTAWAATLAGRPVASARFTDVSRAMPRLPFKGATWQPELPEGGGEKVAVMQGKARTLPARARWEFDAAGPLAFLSDARQLGSARMADFTMSFG